MRIESYGKVYQFGHRHAAHVLDGPVTVQEKVDGSQLSWMVDDEGVLHARSKGVAIDVADPPKLFGPAIEHLRSVTHTMMPGRVHRGEAVCSRRHNQLKYDRTPDGCVVLFDVTGSACAASAAEVAAWSGVSVVPTYAEYVVLTPAELEGYLGRESFLGGCFAEGVVVKNYRVPCPVEGTYPLKAKLVRQEFRELHSGGKGTRLPSADDIRQSLASDFANANRYHKALMRLHEQGVDLSGNEGIGPFLRELGVDLDDECKDVAMAALERWAWKDVKRRVSTDAVSWYKQLLRLGALTREDDDA